ncbi:CHRD domain-containing protein [Leeuwenhoekiella sp. CH_XMU1409-2]|uniref:CHRD domain-containing protein n=1 Tax=Leeuwenhoekiella sp. CH_XMU1409-2 TaxID=3107768 RepID=UPI00300BB758
MKKFYFLALSLFIAASCSNDDDSLEVIPGESTGNTMTYDLSAVSNPDVSGTVTFNEKTDGSTDVSILLSSTTQGSHPAHIHLNTAAEGGDIAIDLEPVDGASRRSLTNITQTNDGTPVSYDDLLNFDGYINVHASADDLGTLLAQGDIGQNDLTGTTKSYDLVTKDVDGISGTATFSERVNGEALLEVMLDGTPDGGMHPGHIHNNSAAETGGIALTLTTLDGTTGMSKTNISALNDGTQIGYAGILDFDGYINFHLSADDLATLVAQGDIGENELTGETKDYELVTKDVEGISGTATFAERKSGAALVTVMLDGTPDGGMHPGHIHNNSAAETGGIAKTLTTLDRTTGMSVTHIEALNDGTEIGYAGLLDFDGYINFHLSADDLATLVAQGDIGENELTGETKDYELVTKDVPGISGTATFAERKSGAALVTVMLDGTPDGGMHPGHIHNNSAAETGGIAKTLTTLDGTTGMSVTHIEALNDGTEIGYAGLLDFDGYINFHLSGDDLATLVAQGDIGENELTGESKEYDLVTKDVPGISGTATFAERKSGAALVTVMLDGTPDGGMHPGHIHNNSAAETGGIAKTLTTLDGTTGMSVTHIEALNDGTEIGYEGLLDFDGYINFHLSADDLATLVAQGDIGQNELTGESMTYDLDTKDVPGISGTATFAERLSGETLVTLDIDGTPAGGMHPAHIHAGAVADAPGAILITLATVDGTSGMSQTNVSAFNAEDGTANGGDAITYDEMIAIDGYINVHLSADDLGTIVAQGNVGSNVE